jgi:hypothetical protein
MAVGTLGQVSDILGGYIAHYVHTIVDNSHACEAFITHKSKSFG